jgi:predicted nucleotidyltransferase
MATIRTNTPSTYSQAMQKVLADYFQTQPVVKAWLFGSFARGEEKSLSMREPRKDPKRLHDILRPQIIDYLKELEEHP